ncbi:hypothetical protein ABID22_003819 [Pontibacter aydingkolensis]|uniref:IrrE N-terminal-like domain-containing protein n=1 Tax=Pontibacter aydingkolensis TaxID=1911536 RepID=A0ABS7CZE2_9BACT|nr:hypothetical protein [Pontibacter aydingkolensis]MBW7469140.1 hypothetical protein [Pontibacter aydingkolensis]
MLPKEELVLELVDERNQKLWNEIDQKLNVKLSPSLNDEYSCYSQGQDIIFYIDENNFCKDSFTHEMLHVYLRLHGLFIGAGLKNTIIQSRILSNVFSSGLIEHLGNCFDHIKMLPMYIDMGFNREKFILDYNTHKCTTSEIQLLKREYKKGNRINSKAADFYIGKYFAIKADPNDSFDYTSQLLDLKKIDPLLYGALEATVKHWEMVKVKDRTILDDDYHQVLLNFYTQMKAWLSKSKFLI